MHAARIAFGVAVILTSLPACARRAGDLAPPAQSAVAATALPSAPGLVLQSEEGERRVRRNPGGIPFILKVDRRNGASPDIVMGQEDLPPGHVFPPHHHLIADEILYIVSGTGIAYLGQREAAVRAGSTVYIPRNVRVSLKNSGAQPMRILFVFSKPGFEEQMRENSVLEGEPVSVMTDQERAAVRKRGEWHTRYDP